jgi:uncharacterized protein YndB with AHSA1/START domain
MAMTAKAALANEATVTITRVFDALRALVWAAWTDPKQMALWWGPRHFTNPVCELDVRVGGKIRIDMCGPDGTIYPMTGTFRDVFVPARLVFMAEARDHNGKALLESLATVTFSEEGAKTRLTVHAHAVGLAPIAPQMLAGMEAGWTQSIDKMEELVG